MENTTIAIIVFVVLLILIGGGIGTYYLVNSNTATPATTTSESELVPIPVIAPIAPITPIVPITTTPAQETPPVVQEETAKPVVQEESVVIATTGNKTTVEQVSGPDCGIVKGSMPNLAQDALVTRLTSSNYKWDNASFGVIRFKNFSASLHKIDVIVRVIGNSSMTSTKKCSTLVRNGDKLVIKNAYNNKDYIFSLLNNSKLQVDDGSGIKDVTKVSNDEYSKMKPVCVNPTNSKQLANSLLSNLLGKKYVWKSTIPFDYIKFNKVPGSTDSVFVTVYIVGADKTKTLTTSCCKLDLSDKSKVVIKNGLGGQDITYISNGVIYGGATYKYSLSSVNEDNDLL